MSEDNNKDFEPQLEIIKLKVSGYQTDHNGVKLYAYPKNETPHTCKKAYHIQIEWSQLKGINFLDV